ncbi:MAG TPA: hypothetical protein GXZ53_04625, partial [Firmicutes bacterium]|nr:hypothetical protein [Bacillota bacterium]
HYVINLKGLINDISLKETFKILSERIPRLYNYVTINIGEAYFSSEATIVAFVKKANELSGKARGIKIKIAPGNKNLLLVLQKYNMTVPRFGIVG